MAKQPMVMFDIPRRERLRKAYQQAVDDGEEQFEFEDVPTPILVGYAKYLLQWLDNELGKQQGA